MYRAIQSNSNSCVPETEEEDDKETVCQSGTSQPNQGGLDRKRVRYGVINFRKTEMYFCDTVNAVMELVNHCRTYLIENEIYSIKTIQFNREFNYDGTEKDIVGELIYNAMAKLHALRFGLFTTDTIERFKSILKSKINNEPMLYAFKNPTNGKWSSGGAMLSSLSMNVIGLLDFIIRLFVNFDQRFRLNINRSF